jgi:hypothetical protein
MMDDRKNEENEYEDSGKALQREIDELYGKPEEDET